MRTKKTATTENNETASICPAGEAFPLPRDEDYLANPLAGYVSAENG